VDARNIRNIALMRPINSMIEFKQIIGRGTRLYDSGTVSRSSRSRRRPRNHPDPDLSRAHARRKSK
jgi:superfamily II DNA or RNA helicase